MTGDTHVPPIIHAIARVVTTSPPEIVARLRFAVTPEEHEQVRQYLLQRDGVFYARIRGCPLIVEETPDNPEITIECAPTKAA